MACANCGRDRNEHRLANFFDAPQIGAPVLICPTSTWSEAPKPTHAGCDHSPISHGAQGCNVNVRDGIGQHKRCRCTWNGGTEGGADEGEW